MKYSRLLVILLIGLLLGIISPNYPAKANDEAPLAIAANAWLGGNGVAICSSGTALNCGGEAHVGGIPSNWWQCVELAQRLYKSKGWYSGIFSGVNYAYQIYDVAASLGMIATASGSINTIVPGDMIIHSPGQAGADAAAGHVALVDRIVGNTIFAVQQNPTGTATYTFNDRTLKKDGVEVEGIVHDPDNQTVIDSDGDSIPNNTDQCPNEPGPPYTNGCPDHDGDGLRNSEDLAPTIPGPTNNRGFPLNDRIISGDFNGDGYGDSSIFYDYGNNHTKLWVLYGRSSGVWPLTLVWDSGSGNWNAQKSKTTAADVNGDGKSDIVAFYDYGELGARAWVFYGSTSGSLPPVQKWHSGAGNWSLQYTQLVGGDFNGDGLGDVGAFYDYGTRTRLWLFKGTPLGFEPEYVQWDSGPGNWSLASTKLVVANTNGDAYDDIVGFYDYGQQGVRAWTFYGLPTGPAGPTVTWYSGPGNWAWAPIQLAAGDTDNNGYDDVVALYDNGSQGVALWVFHGSASGMISPQNQWNSDAGNWVWSALRSTASDYNNDGRVNISAFYSYGGSQTRLWRFGGTSSGPGQPQVIWDSGPGNWEWSKML